MVCFPYPVRLALHWPTCLFRMCYLCLVFCDWRAIIVSPSVGTAKSQHGQWWRWISMGTVCRKKTVPKYPGYVCTTAVVLLSLVVARGTR